MCLAIGPGGSTVFTSGPDQRVCQFIRARAPGGEWVLVSAKRLHAHDVRALAVWPPYVPVPITTDAKHGNSTVGGGLAPVLASGGWDMSPTFTPASHPSSPPLPSPLARPSQSQTLPTFESTHPRRMGYLSSGLLSSSSPITFSPSARLVVGKRARGVGIWRVHPNENGWEKLLEMELRLRTTIIATTISEHGKYLAVSDLYETKLFKLVPTSSGLKPTRLPLLPALLSSPLLHHLNTQLTTQGCGSTSMVFTPDGGRVVLGLVTGQVLIIELAEDEENVEVEVVKCFERKERVVRGRVIKGKNVNGTGVNGNNTAPDIDVSMTEKAEEQESNSGSESESESESDSPSTFHSNGAHKQTQNEWISTLAVSEDGQWLGVADLEGRVEVFNLDSLQVSPFFPLSQGPRLIPYPQTASLHSPHPPSPTYNPFLPLPPLSFPLPRHPLPYQHSFTIQPRPKTVHSAPKSGERRIGKVWECFRQDADAGYGYGLEAVKVLSPCWAPRRWRRKSIALGDRLPRDPAREQGHAPPHSERPRQWRAGLHAQPLGFYHHHLID